MATTFDAATKPGFATISNAGKTVVGTTVTGYTDGTTRSVDSASGKIYVKLQCDVRDNNADWCCGFCLSSWPNVNIELGGSSNSIGMFDDGGVFSNGFTSYGDASPGGAQINAGTVVELCWDAVNRLFWAKLSTDANGWWNQSSTANPGSGTGGISITGVAASQTWFFAVATPESANALNNGYTILTGTPPSGFTELGPTGGGSTAVTASNLRTGALSIPSVGPIAQKHVITATSKRVAALSLPTPALQQKHVIVTAGMRIGSPTFSPVALLGTLIANNLRVGSPILPTPVLRQVHTLSVPALRTAALGLQKPALQQKHVIVPQSLRTTALSLPRPVLNGAAQPTLFKYLERWFGMKVGGG